MIDLGSVVDKYRIEIENSSGKCIIFFSFQESEEMRCRYRDQPEHQMRHPLGANGRR